MLVDEKLDAYIIDLCTSNGTKINDGPNIKPFVPYKVENDNVIVFGASTRTYRFEIDREAYRKKKEQLYSKIANLEGDSTSSSTSVRSKDQR